jgi:hypothetical protein
MFGTGSGPQLSSAPSRHIGFILVGANYSCTDQLCHNVEIGVPNIRTLCIYVSKDVAILCYFSKPRGVKEQRRLKNTGPEGRLLLLVHVYSFAGSFRLD